MTILCARPRSVAGRGGQGHLSAWPRPPGPVATGPWRGLLVLALACLGGCASTPGFREGSSLLVEDLHRQVEERRDPATLRLLVLAPVARGPDSDHPGASYWIATGSQRVEIGSELEQELLAACLPYFHLVEASLVPDGSGLEEEARRISTGSHGEATALLLGEFTRVAEERIRASLRIVDLGTGVVLAAARRDLTVR